MAGNRSRPRFVVGCCCVPVGGGPPARSPHASLRLGVVDLEAWPSSAAAHRHLGPAPRATRASRFPPHRRCLVCWWVIGVVLKLGQALRTLRHLGPAPRATRASRFPPCVNLRLGVVDLEARPSPPDPPAPSTPAVPGVLVGDRRRFEARLCPAAAHGHRRQAPQPGLFCPAAHALPSTPAVPGVLVGDRRRFEARPGPAPAHRHPPAPRPGSAGLAVPSTKGGAWCAGGVIGVVLKPGYALPPPTGTAMGTSRRLYACVGFQSGLLGGAALGAGWRRVVGVSRL